jgi:hypothetical protein
MPSRRSAPPATPTAPARRKHPNTKRTGELAEAAFVVKAAGLGFAVSKPWGDSERYDFILDAGHATFRVQIKCTESLNANGYQVQSTYTDRNQKGHYSTADIDFLVGYILPLDLWYVVPSNALPPSASLRFYPEGNISRRARFEQYREAWHVFRKPKQPNPQRAIPELAAPKAYSQDSQPQNSPPIESTPCSATSPLPAPDRVEAPPELERTMTAWSNRVSALYNRKR